MSDSPRSERFDTTRFSTPVSELDDHRHQQLSLPRAESGMTIGHGGHIPHTPRASGRRGTLASIRIEHPELFDFQPDEDVIEDDGESCRNVVTRQSSSPANARRLQYKQGTPSIRSKNSASSSRSDLPNSVEAFADPRRRQRSGTIDTVTASEHQAEIRRTVSAASHRSHRQPTIASERNDDDDGRFTAPRTNEDVASSIEEDICYPQDSQDRPNKIDYEELEEYMATEAAIYATKGAATERTAEDEQAAAREASRCSEDIELDQIPNGMTPGEAFRLDRRLSNTAVDRPNDAQLLALLPSRKAAQRKKFTFFSTSFDETIHAGSLGGLLNEGENLRDLFEPSDDPDSVWWLDILNPDEDCVYAICKAFGVHPLTREDIWTQESREKVELFKSYYFLCFKSFVSSDKSSDEYMDPLPIYAVVFREGLLTFSYNANPHAGNVRARLAKLRDYVQLGSDWICYAIIDDIVDGFAPVIREVGLQTESIEDEVVIAREDDSSAMLRTISDCRKQVMALIRLLGGKADVIKGFAKRCNEKYEAAPRGDVGMYLSDIQDHVVTMMSNLSHFEKNLGRSHSNYLALINLQSLDQGNKVSDKLGKVTLLASIVVPMNLITGLFGMNVRIPGQAGDNLAWWFGILGVIGGFIIAMFFYARAKKWL